MASYFGPVSLRVESRLDDDRIDATVECLSNRRPKTVELRLPHPLGWKATRVKGGVYDAEKELVRLEPFDGRAKVTLEFAAREQ